MDRQYCFLRTIFDIPTADMLNQPFTRQRKFCWELAFQWGQTQFYCLHEANLSGQDSKVQSVFFWATYRKDKSYINNGCILTFEIVLGSWGLIFSDNMCNISTIPFCVSGKGQIGAIAATSVLCLFLTRVSPSHFKNKSQQKIPSLSGYPW